MYRGTDGIRRFMRDNDESFDLFQLEYDEVRYLGDGRVLAIGRVRVGGKGSGVETEVPVAGISTFHDGKAVRWEDFGDRAKAEAAAGF